MGDDGAMSDPELTPRGQIPSKETAPRRRGEFAQDESAFDLSGVETDGPDADED